MFGELIEKWFVLRRGSSWPKEKYMNSLCRCWHQQWRRRCRAEFWATRSGKPPRSVACASEVEILSLKTPMFEGEKHQNYKILSLNNSHALDRFESLIWKSLNNEKDGVTAAGIQSLKTWRKPTHSLKHVCLFLCFLFPSLHNECIAIH